MNGTDGDDRMVGGPGDDELVGLLGDDRYFIFDPDVEVIEASGGGDDWITTTVSYTLGTDQEIEVLRAYAGTSAGLILTGNDLDNCLVGGDGNDTLIGLLGDDKLAGGLGADSMTGGGGNDRYYVDNTADQVIEASGGGIDIVFTRSNFTLGVGQEVEYLRAYADAPGVMLTGNALDNCLIGAAGNDELNGGAGNDRLIGRAGNDTITTVGDSAEIDAGEGDDTIRLDGTATSTGTVNGGIGDDTVSSTDLGEFVIRNVETLDTYYGFLTASVRQVASFDAYTAVLAAADMQISISLRGEGGTLDFTTGISGQNSVEIRDGGLTSAIRITGSVNGDTMFGTIFNDAFNGGNGGDVLLSGDGRDWIDGGAGNDRLNGGDGNDRLTGGIGDDTFVFDAPISGGNNVDRIFDFTSAADTIEINQEFYFNGLTVGSLDPAQFAIGTATGAGPQIVYSQSNGALYYDSDGAGGTGGFHFATLVGAPTLVASDFLIV
jgi:serralysin